MSVLFQSAFLKALGWSLLDSLWQMGLIWVVYVILTANGKRFHANQRHALALMSLTGGSLWFLINFFTRLTISINDVAGFQKPSGGFPGFSGLSFLIEPLLPIFSILYLIAIAFLFLKLYRQYNQTHRLFCTGLQKAPVELRMFLKNAAEHIGIRKNVRIWLSNLVDTPLTIGFWKPVILLPVAAINHLSVQQAEAIILHELNHISRNDYLINLLIACVDIILFFNPFARTLAENIKKEREHRCDDLVLQFRYDASQYAKALLLLEQNRVNANTFFIAATGKSKKLLLNRIRRMLSQQQVIAPVNQKLIAYFISTAIIALIGFYNPAKMMITPNNDRVKMVASIANTETPAPFASFNTPVAEGITPAKKKSPVIVTVNNNDKNENISLDEIIDWISEVKLNEADPEEHYAILASAQSQIREFSIPEAKINIAPTVNLEAYPFIPSNSFSYNMTEDTALPKKYVLTFSELKAKESLDKAIKALHEINWQKLEKEINSNGKKMDIVKLQSELKKAMEDIDWKKINEEMESSLEAAENTLKENEVIRHELEKFQQNRIIKKEQSKKIQELIIDDRVNQSCEESNKKVVEKKSPVTVKKVKKVIWI